MAEKKKYKGGISAKQYEKLYAEGKEDTVKKAVRNRKSSRKRLTSGDKPKSTGGANVMDRIHDEVVKQTSLGQYTNDLLRMEGKNIQTKKKSK
jgi:hypothetical protein